jgi:hypothetical protein
MEKGHRRRASEQLASATQQLEREKARVRALQQLLQQHGIDFEDILHKASAMTKIRLCRSVVADRVHVLVCQVDSEHKQEDARFAALSPRTRR